MPVINIVDLERLFCEEMHEITVFLNYYFSLENLLIFMKVIFRISVYDKFGGEIWNH